jgi:simple sugar transport system permease protein
MRQAALPVFSVTLAFLAGAVILKLTGIHPAEAGRALFSGAFGDMEAIARTLEKATPLVFSGLAVALALKAGLFNIGAQGQLLLGAMIAAAAGFSCSFLPVYLQLPFAVVSGALAAAGYGAFQGWLKARSGAHEVITGIMLNYVAINLCDFFTKGPFMDRAFGNTIPRTPEILSACRLPVIHGLPVGFFVAVFMAFMVFWFVTYTVKGFEMRTVGVNPTAARYSGMKPSHVIVLSMALSGALAGLGGTVETLGVLHRFQPGFNPGLGFEGITIALLARVNPLGVIPAALLLGALKAGAGMMQFETGASTEIIDVIQALMLFFLAADALFRSRISLSTGWGSKA